MVGTWASGLWKQHDVCDPARRWDKASQTEKVHTEVDLGAPSKKIIFFLVYFRLQVFQDSARKLDGQLTKRSTTFAQFLFIYFLKLLIRAGRCRQECRIRNIIVTYLDADLNDIVVNSSLPARRHLFSSAPPIVFLYPSSEPIEQRCFFSSLYFYLYCLWYLVVHNIMWTPVLILVPPGKHCSIKPAACTATESSRGGKEIRICIL